MELEGGPSGHLRWRVALRPESPGLEPPRFLLQQDLVSQKADGKAIEATSDIATNVTLLELGIKDQ